MKIRIYLNTLKDGKFVFITLATMPFTASLSAICNKMALIANKRFGANGALRNDNSLTGYYVNKVTGETIQMEHSV